MEFKILIQEQDKAAVDHEVSLQVKFLFFLFFEVHTVSSKAKEREKNIFLLGKSENKWFSFAVKLGPMWSRFSG